MLQLYLKRTPLLAVGDYFCDSFDIVYVKYFQKLFSNSYVNQKLSLKHQTGR